MLELIKDIGKGGAGEGGQGSNTVFSALRELQGLNISLLTGAAANTKINLAAIRPEDTIIGAINNNAGTLTDVLANMSISDVKATGTLTLAGVVADDTVVVAGVTFTAKLTVSSLNHFTVVVGNNNTTAANLAAAINKYFKNYDNKVTATANAAVVTVTATAEGTTPNSYTLVGGAHITPSGATLSGGTTTGGVKCTSVTNQIILFWYNKK